MRRHRRVVRQLPAAAGVPCARRRAALLLRQGVLLCQGMLLLQVLQLQHVLLLKLLLGQLSAAAPGGDALPLRVLLLLLRALRVCRQVLLLVVLLQRSTPVVRLLVQSVVAVALLPLLPAVSLLLPLAGRRCGAPRADARVVKQSVADGKVIKVGSAQAGAGAAPPDACHAVHRPSQQRHHHQVGE